MNDFYKDILIGMLFITGLLGFVSGEFIISSLLFATAAVASNVNLNVKQCGKFTRFASKERRRSTGSLTLVERRTTNPA